MALDVVGKQAEAAAEAAGVCIEPVEDPRRLLAVAEMFAEVWASPPGQDPLAADVLRAVAHAGGAVHVAFRDGPVGAAAACFGPPASGAVYSLIAAARSSDKGTGFALKLAQRAWALGHGVSSMMWTFDPLVSRNARFNLVKLGAVASEYLIDFYGPLGDGVNDGDETDRLTAVWPLAGHRAHRAAEGRPEQPGNLPPTSDRAAPDGGPLTARSGDVLWCRVPSDIVAVRRNDPALAACWRVAVREVLVPALAEGYVATGMTRDGWYRLEVAG